VSALKAIVVGIISGLVSVLIYQSLPPFGIAAALTFTYLAIWWVGRETNKKFYKAITAVMWFLVIYRAGTFGVGDELLITANNLGTAIFFLGTVTAFISTLRRI
jgi:hypothetical protein